MKYTMEKGSLLALSLMLVSTYAISPALPEMIHYYGGQGIASDKVELLVSLPSFAIIAMLLLTPFLSRLLSERVMIVAGLLLLALGGVFPLFNQSYGLVFLSRLVLGLGIGLINARAISIISQRFSGRERMKMLGLRGSSEVLGSALLTFIAGQLLGFSWVATFSIYALALLILVLYLLFVPQQKPVVQVDVKESEKVPTPKLGWKDLGMILLLALYAGFVILVNSANTLRIPVVVTSLKIGTAQQASLILSLMMLMGILAGALFGNLVIYFKHYLMSLVALVLGAGLLVMWRADNLFLMGFGALLTGFVYSLGVTYVFNLVSEKIPKAHLHTATTLVLLGCNLGGALAPIALGILGHFTTSVVASFATLGVVSLLLGLILLVRSFLLKKG